MNVYGQHWSRLKSRMDFLSGNPINYQKPTKEQGGILPSPWALESFSGRDIKSPLVCEYLYCSSPEANFSFPGNDNHNTESETGNSQEASCLQELMVTGARSSVSVVTFVGHVNWGYNSHPVYHVSISIQCSGMWEFASQRACMLHSKMWKGTFSLKNKTKTLKP